MKKQAAREAAAAPPPKPASRAAAAVFSPAQRRYFYFTAAVTGAAIMVVEILGAKMLAPYVGTTHFVWTAQIAVTLAALAAGYYVGGLWVDRSPRLTALYLGILAAAVYLCGAALLVGPVANACLRFELALGSLLAATFLFFVPLALLAAVGPFLVRVLTHSVDDVGHSVGRLTSISTLGSLIGTGLIGYVLIPLLPNSTTMVLTAIVLMLVAGLHLLVWGRGLGMKAAPLLVLALGGASLHEAQSTPLLVGAKLEEIYRGNSNFGQLQVIQSRDGSRRYFLNDYLMQGAYDTAAHQGVLAFAYLLHDLPGAYGADVRDVLCIGLGAGIVPMQFAREGARVDVVEINPAMIPLATQYFDLDPALLNITVGDGRNFINASRRQYDVIVLDAFLGDSIPSHLMTREAFAAMRSLLRPGGVLVINTIGDFEAGRDFLAASLHKTLARVFTSVVIHGDPHPGTSANLFFVAAAESLAIKRPPAFERVPVQSREQVEAAFARTLRANPDHGRILTDDYNPVDYYDAANRERERRAMAMMMRS